MGAPPQKRKAYPSVAQKARLVCLLEADPELRGGKFTSSFTIKESVARWTAIADELNSIPGGKKDYKQWRKTWQDMRAKAKKRDAEVRRSTNRTGGGSPPPPLTLEEEQVLSTISESARTGHSDCQESLVSFFDLESTTETSNDHSHAAPPIYHVEITDPESTSTQGAENIKKRPKTKILTKPRRLQRSLDVAGLLNKNLKEKNEIKKEFYRQFIVEMRKQSDALSLIGQSLATMTNNK